MAANHTWKFFRAGGFNQVVISSGADLLNLDQLDQKLWVALACPTTGVEFDKATLALIDTDKDGRVRAPELIAAAKWAGGLLKNPDDLLKGSPTLKPSAINDATPEGKLIANFARQVLGKDDNGEVTFDEAAAAAANIRRETVQRRRHCARRFRERRCDQSRHCRHHQLPRRGHRCQRQARHQPGQGGSVFRRSRRVFRLVEKGGRRRDRAAARREHRSRRRRRQSGQGQGGRLFCARPAGRV